MQLVYTDKYEKDLFAWGEMNGRFQGGLKKT